MEGREFKVVAKVPFQRRRTVLLRISDGAGMLAGNTTQTQDIETGTPTCDLKEGQELQNFSNSKIVDPRCLTCIFHALICQASA